MLSSRSREPLREFRADESARPTRAEAERAVRTLIAWAGDDPDREGLRDTPKRVAKAYEDFYAGYRQSAEDALERTFEDLGGYDDIVLVRDIPFYSHCEHHMVPFVGKAHVAYYPGEKVVGLSKLARVVDIFARRLQTQERLTSQIVDGNRRDAEAARHRRDDRGRAPVHDAARRPQARRLDGHHPVHRRLPRRPGRAAAVPDTGGRHIQPYSETLAGAELVTTGSARRARLFGWT